jgi:hypothetical protein
MDNPEKMARCTLPFSLDCPYLIAPSSCVPYAAIFSGLSINKTKGQSNKNNPEKMAA